MFTILIQILVLLLLAFFIILSLILNDKLNRLKKTNLQADYLRGNISVKGNYTSRDYTVSGNEIRFDSYQISDSDKFDIGNDVAGGYIKRNGNIIANGLSTNIKVVINGSVQAVNATHVEVKGNVLSSLNATHLKVEGSVNNGGKINTSHLTVEKDLTCDSIVSTHVTIKGKALVKSIKATHVYK